VYRSRPATARIVLPFYLAHPIPRPSVIYLPNINPPTILFSLLHSTLLFLVPASRDTEPLFILEFLHRLVDVLEEFLGAPLLAGKIEGSYDVVAQLLGEMCDAGSVCNTEPNALREMVDMPGWMNKLLGGVGLPGYEKKQKR
jgi:AP-3 complex subunit mu